MGWNELIGSQLGRYRISAELGRGGSSRVYRAFDPERQRDVAIKVIPNDAEDRLTFVRRFNLEVEIVLKLSHPNIIEIYEKGKTEEYVYLVMECANGGTLRQLLGHALPTEQAIAYIVQMAHALHHAHEKEIVHRDVKPSNMLMDSERPGHVLLTDFGIAKIQGMRGLTKSGTTIGTPEYMAPEQAEGGEIDRRADIYALGCVLYEALVGRPPFTGATPVSVLYQQVHARPAYIRGFNPDVPPELAHIIERALAKQPEDRFPTAEAFAQALEPFREESPHITSNGMAEIPARSPEVRTAQGSSAAGTDGARAEAPPPPSHAALFAPVDVRLDADTETPPAAHHAPPSAPPPSAEADGALPPDAVPTLPGGRRARSAAIAPRLLGLPSKPSQPRAREAATDAASSLTPPQGEERGHGQPPWPHPTSDPEHATPRARAPLPDPVVPWGAGAREQVHSNVADEETLAPVSLAPVVPSPSASPARVWDPTTDEIETVMVPAPRRRRRRRGSPMVIGVAIAAVLLVSLASWLGVSAWGIWPVGVGGASGHAPTVAVATTPPSTLPTPTATQAPTPTATPSPTATPNVQQQVDAQARASFRSVVLAAYPDASCAPANGTNRFTPGQTIYVNLCMSDGVASGPMSIFVRQGGTILFSIASGRYLVAGGSFIYTAKLDLNGTFDILVTITINGRSAAARDLYFTVG
ncbi:MAG: protein kinase [Ktedonobacterales bacterium]|nr:protein kinase [Ktedonobacterales bacterium]